MDLAKLTGGSGIFRYRGLELESQDGITVTPELETSNIAIDGISKKADERVTANSLMIEITPSGEWTNPDRMYPYLTWPMGRLVLPVLPASINPTTDVLTVTNHQFYTGDRVMLGIRNGGVVPTSTPQVDEDSWYYVRVVTVDTITLHSTRLNANANTSPINFSNTGTDVMIVAQFDAEIIGEDGDRFTFHAVAIEDMPDMDLNRKDAPFGALKLRAYIRNRKRPTDADAMYTKDSPGFPGWTASASDIKTQSAWVAWADQLKVTAVDLSTNQLTIVAHGLVDTNIVYGGSTGTFPTSTPALDPDRAYYVKKVTNDTLTLHLTAAAATAGTGAIDFTVAGTGDFFLTVDNPGYTLMDTEAGVKLTMSCDIEKRESDRDGVYNGRLSDCSAEAKFIATSLTAMNVLNMLKLQGTGAAPGRSLSAASKMLNFFSLGMFVRVNGAAPKAGDLNWSMSENRARELTFVNTRVVTNGSLQPVAVIGSQIP